MYFITYDPHFGYTVPDGFVYSHVREMINYHEQFGSVRGSYSNESIITALRLAVISGNINHNDINFIFEDVTIPVNEFGVCLSYPDGFCEVGSELSAEILTRAMNKRREREARKQEQ